MADDTEYKSAIEVAASAYREAAHQVRRLNREHSELSALTRQLKSPTVNLFSELKHLGNSYAAQVSESQKYQELLKLQISAEKNDVQKKIKENILLSEETKELTLKYKRISASAISVTRYFVDLSKELSNLVKIIRDTQREFAIGAGEAAKLRFENFVTGVDSFVSAITTFGKTIPVTAAQIQRAQLDFQEQFGVLIDAQEAETLAAEATKLGVTTRQLAEARRVFLTQSMGDVSRAAELEKEFTKGFEEVLGPGGAKAAFEFIGKNSELLARAGTRFQQSLMRAAAEAKKIGVDLNKVNQVGDNIIGNFEGFLESMAELGAMGFDFDSTRLAQIAETGDTDALFTELQSQLARTGKDITDLRRSEQLALSRAFGMSIEDMQRMAGVEFEKPVEQKLQEESNSLLTQILTKLGIFDRVSDILERFGPQLTNFGQALAPAVGIFFKGANWALQLALLSTIALNTSGLKLSGLVGGARQGVSRVGTALVGRRFLGGQFMPGGIRAPAGGARAGGILSPVVNIFNRAASVVQSAFVKITGPISNAFTSIVGRIGNMISKIPGVGRVVTGATSRLAAGGGLLRAGGRTGVLAGAVGGVMGFGQGRAQGLDTQGAAGAAGVRGGAALGGATLGGAIGTMIAPGVGTVIGSVVGGFLGDKLGGILVEKAPGLSIAVGKMFGSMLETIKKPFANLSGPFNMISKQLKENFGAIGDSFNKVGDVLIRLGLAKEVDGVSSAFSFLGKLLGEVINIPLNLLVGVLNLLGGAISLVSGLTTTLIQLFTGDLKGAWNTFMATLKNVGISIANAIISALNMIPFVNFKLLDGESETTADDMVSRPGYGDRTLVTPQGNVALNNQDNIVAYADDMIARNAGIDLLSKGAITQAANTPAPIVNIDMSRLERKLDQLLTAIGSMEVRMDGSSVGRVVATSEALSNIGIGFNVTR